MTIVPFDPDKANALIDNEIVELDKRQSVRSTEEDERERAERIEALEATMTPRQIELARLLAELLIADYRSHPPKK